MAGHWKLNRRGARERGQPTLRAHHFTVVFKRRPERSGGNCIARKIISGSEAGQGWVGYLLFIACSFVLCTYTPPGP